MATDNSILAKLQKGDSSLGFNGQTPNVNTVAGANGVVSLLANSNLDLNNGQTPVTYKDKAPEGQAGRV